MADNTHHCPICDKAFKTDDVCATDITEGVCHAACLEGSPVVDPETGEPIDGPASTYPYSEVCLEAEGDGQGALVEVADRHLVAAPVSQEPVARSDVFDWLETELRAVDCRYRGDPAYDHDAYWFRDRALNIVAEARRMFASPQPLAEGEPSEAELKAALEPFAQAWEVATHHKDLVAKLTMAQLGELAAHEVSGVHFRNAQWALAAKSKGGQA